MKPLFSGSTLSFSPPPPFVAAAAQPSIKLSSVKGTFFSTYTFLSGQNTLKINNPCKITHVFSSMVTLIFLLCIVIMYVIQMWCICIHRFATAKRLCCNAVSCGSDTPWHAQRRSQRVRTDQDLLKPMWCVLVCVRTVWKLSEWHRGCEGCLRTHNVKIRLAVRILHPTTGSVKFNFPTCSFAKQTVLAVEYFSRNLHTTKLSCSLHETSFNKLRSFVFIVHFSEGDRLRKLEKK